MNKVFITKYLIDTGNDALPIYDAVEFDATLKENENRLAEITVNTPIDFKVTANGASAITDGKTKVTSGTLRKGLTSFVLYGDSSAKQHISFLNARYNPVFTRIYCNYGAWTSASLKWQTQLSEASFVNSASLSGNIEDLKDIPLITLKATSGTLTGDISSLPQTLTSIELTGHLELEGNLSSVPSGITSLKIEYSPKIKGSLEELAQRLYNLHKGDSREFSLNVYLGHCGITFNEKAIPRFLKIKVASSLTVLNLNDVAVGIYDGTSWTYNG